MYLLMIHEQKLVWVQVYSCTHIKHTFLMWCISHWLVEVSTSLLHVKRLPCQFLWPFWGPSRARSLMWCETRLWLHKPGKAFPLCIHTLPWDKSINWSMCGDSPLENRPSTWVMVSTGIQGFPLPSVFSSNGKREVQLHWHFNLLSFSFCTFHGSKLNFRLAIALFLGLQKRGDQYKHLVVVWGLSNCSPVRLYIGFLISRGFFFICILQTWIITVNCVSLLNDTFIFHFQRVWHCIPALQWEVAEWNNSFPS